MAFCVAAAIGAGGTGQRVLGVVGGGLVAGEGCGTMETRVEAAGEGWGVL